MRMVKATCTRYAAVSATAARTRANAAQVTPTTSAGASVRREASDVGVGPRGSSNGRTMVVEPVGED